MSATDLSIVVLAGLFLLALVPRAHLGLAAFPAAFLVAAYANVEPAELTAFFPSDFFVLIVGVMSLFAIAQTTGGLQLILDGALKLVGGRKFLMPLIPLVLGGVLCAIGTLPGAVAAIMAPIAMGMSRRYGLSPFLMAYATLVGGTVGMFSPIAVFGLATKTTLASLDMPVPNNASLTLGLAFVVAGSSLVAMMTIAFILLGRLRVPEGEEDVTIESASSDTEHRRVAQVVSITSLVVLLVCAVVFELNVGYLAFTLAFVLLLALRLDPNEIINRIPWGVVVLIGGLLTYIGLMGELGAFERLGGFLTFGSSPMLGLLAVCYVAAVTSFFANSLAVIVSSLPLLPVLVADGVSPLGAVLAVTLCAVVVDVNPLGPAGGLILGSTRPEQRTTLFRSLLTYGVITTIVAPPLLTLTVGWI